ncbi:MAG TPA: PQQ-dependent sugar dehydrogenase [Blastocatellia bacterium]|nr:PQQ-dependent sugar dehydrogenase [Blastocatellia bacterium]
MNSSLRFFAIALLMTFGATTILSPLSSATAFSSASGMAQCAQLRDTSVAQGFTMTSRPAFASPDNVPEFALQPTSGPTSLAFDSRGRLFVGTLSGKILILLDNDDNGFADQVKEYASGLGMVLGITFRNDRELWVTSNIPGGVGRIIRLRDLNNDDVADEQTIIVDNLPSQGDHQTNRLKFAPNGFLFFGQGSATDAGTPAPGRPGETPLNGTIIAINPSDPQLNIYATGLRNPFGMAFNPAGELFAADVGSGELCQNVGGQGCPEDVSPPEEINWIVPGGNYGFPLCEGTPLASRPECSGVRGPLIQYPRHTTPTALAFYTGPQANEFQGQMLVTLLKLAQDRSVGGDLRRVVVQGDQNAGFTLRDDGFIAQFNPIDPFDGPVDVAVDPISGDIYVARLDVVSHCDLHEHHHFIYRIHRFDVLTSYDSDRVPFIGPLIPSSVRVNTRNIKIAVVGKHLKPGAVLFDVTDNIALTTRQGATIFDLEADLPDSLAARALPITLEVRNPDGGASNRRTFGFFVVDPPPPVPPMIDSIFVYKKKRSRVVNPVIAGSSAKKLRLVVDGTDFGAGAEVLINGLSATVESSSSTELICRFLNQVIANPGDVTIQVRRTSDAQTSNIVHLTVSP